MNKKLFKRIIVGSFVLVPLLSSIISTLHIVDFFDLGNPNWISVVLAITIEVGAIASFLTLSILGKLNKIIVWSIFFLLFFMQIIGNMYFSYDFIAAKMTTNPQWIQTFKEMIEFFMGNMNVNDVKMYLTILISWPIPIISLGLLKSLMDYVGEKAEEPPEVEAGPDNEASAEKEVAFYDMKKEDRDSFRKEFTEDGSLKGAKGHVYTGGDGISGTSGLGDENIGISGTSGT